MESVNVAKRLQKASCNRKAPGLIPEMANICVRSCFPLSGVTKSSSTFALIQHNFLLGFRWTQLSQVNLTPPPQFAYLTVQQQAFAHVSHTDHETGKSLMM